MIRYPFYKLLKPMNPDSKQPPMYYVEPPVNYLPLKRLPEEQIKHFMNIGKDSEQDFLDIVSFSKSVDFFIQNEDGVLILNLKATQFNGCYFHCESQLQQPINSKDFIHQKNLMIWQILRKILIEEYKIEH